MLAPFSIEELSDEMSYPPRKDRNQKKKRNIKPLILIILAILVILVGIFFGYVSDFYKGDETAYAFLKDTEEVQYLGDDPIHFSPVESSDIGIIFYTGGKVDEVSYTPIMQPLAEFGYETFIPKMPFNLVVFNIDAADEIIEDHPEIDHWYVSGHSLGAAMAAGYVADNLDKIEGLISLAGYSTADLSDTDLPVLTLYGSQDAIINAEKVEEYRPNLPDQTIEKTITGGNHGQFGRYGEQDGDGQAEISSEEQLAETITAIHDFISLQNA